MNYFDLSILDLNPEFNREMEEISKKRKISELLYISDSDDEEISWAPPPTAIYIPVSPSVDLAPTPDPICDNDPDYWSPEVVEAVEDWIINDHELTSYLVSLFDGDTDIDDDPLCFQDR